MSKKDNFSQAMYEMFGLGKTPDEGDYEGDVSQYEQPVSTPAPEAQPVYTEPEPVAYEPAEPEQQIVYEQAPMPVQTEAPQPVAGAVYAEQEPANTLPVAQPKREDNFFDSFSRNAAPVRRANTTFFAEGTSMEGTLRSDSDIEIAGDFKGEIASNGKVTVHANINSSIAASDLVLIDCNLIGDAVISGDVSINENSSVTGNVRASNVICSGVVRGNLQVSGNVTLTESAQVIGDIKTGTLTTSRGAKVSGRVDMGS